MQDFKDKIKEIISDNQSGSTTILNSTIDALLGIFNKKPKPDINEVVLHLNRLIGFHSNFVVLFHFINAIFAEIEKNPDTQNLTSFISDYKIKWENAGEKASENFIDKINLKHKTVLLHSNSTAIRTLFLKLVSEKIFPTVFQTLSVPAEEGKLQAKYLSKLGFNINFIHESAVAKFIQKIDLVVFGADIITEDRFLNKTGTFPISLLFKHYNKPVYVISDSRKIINTQDLSEETKSGLLNEKEKPGEEIWDNPPKNINPLNYYFEFTPNNLVAEFYTEKPKLAL